jgi:hydrogenase expression/formation protein HypD
LKNFSVLMAHVLVPPALTAILNGSGARVDGFLAAGHVCTVMGWREYEWIAQRYRVPIVVTGFEPLDIVEGVRLAVTQLEQGRCEVENQYSRAVVRDGNQHARRVIEAVFEAGRREWRGIGAIPDSGLQLRREFAAFDALLKFGITPQAGKESRQCISGRVLQGLAKPTECPAFARACTPESPLGAPMVSSEGACAAYYQWSRS